MLCADGLELPSHFIAVTAVASDMLGTEHGGDRIVGGVDKSRAGCAVVHRGFTGAEELGLGLAQQIYLSNF